MRKVWLNYDEVCLYVTIYQSDVEEKCDTRPDIGAERHTNMIGQTGRPLIQ